MVSCILIFKFLEMWREDIKTLNRMVISIPCI
jgi:hypothetical protein